MYHTTGFSKDEIVTLCAMITDKHGQGNKVGRNTQVNSIRYQIERTIAHLKTWRILHTDYRRPLHTFAETTTTVIALEFYRTAF